ncbi:MAG: glutamate--tRNA ligase family protein, partial [Roseiarcus sp.]
LRLDAARALAAAPSELFWREFGEGARQELRRADPAAWGDFVLRGKDNAASYHLAVVVDDSLQGVSDVVRGRDLLPATSAHRLLQSLLDLEPPRYRHHRLVLDANGAKMAKSASSPPLRALREAGHSAFAVRAALGFEISEAPRLVVRFS